MKKYLYIGAICFSGFMAAMCSTHKEEYYTKSLEFPAEATEEEKIDMASRLVPDARQLQWQDLEMTAFLHFGVNTFTDREWGDGKEDPKVFNPANLDCRQWVKTLKDAGFKMVILTAKHHDGFCLWPTEVTDHSVKSSDWLDGKGDVMRDLRAACDEYGMKLGVYLSPWDRNAEVYGDSPKYNDFFVAQLTELLTNYGKIDEVWFDGACGEGPNGKKQEYDWARFRETIASLQPEAVMAISGEDVRWVGNEGGVGRETEWSATVYAPTTLPECEEQNGSLEITGTSKDLGSRELVAKSKRLYWYPSEVDVSVRPGWFYHDSENVKSLRDLANIYLTSVGRNSVLLLNIPPDRNGRIAPGDSIRLMELRRWIDTNFTDNLVNDKGAALNGSATVNCVVIEEDISRGQRVEEFTVIGKTPSGDEVELAKGTTVGKKRILTFDPTEVSEVSVRVDKYRGKGVNLLPVKAYSIVMPDAITETGNGFTKVDNTGWRAVTKGAEPAIDGDDATFFTTSDKEIVVDMGQPVEVAGFTYLPRQDGDTEGMIFKYEFAVSADGKNWTSCQLPGEFSNIVNNPISQCVYLPRNQRARYIRLTNLGEVEGRDVTTAAEIGVLTK